MIDRAIFRLPGVRRVLVAALVLSILRAFAVVGQAVGLANAVVNLWGGQPWADQLTWVALFLVCFVARQLIANAQSALLERFAAERADELRGQLLAATFFSGPQLTARMGSAAVAQAVIDGVEDVQTYIALIIPKIISVAVIPAVLLLAIFRLDWVSGVIALVCYPFIILYMVMIGHNAKDEAARRHGEFQRMSNHFMDSVTGIDELRAFGQSKAYGDHVFAASERFREMTMKTLRVAQLSSAVLDMFSTLALAGVAVMLGFRLVDGSAAFFPALAVLIMVPEYFRPIREFASDYHASLDGRSAFAAIRKVIDEAGEVGKDMEVAGEPLASEEDALPPVGMRERSAGEPLAGARAVAQNAAGWETSLELVDVGFAYPDHPHALQGVNLKVQGPCRVGVVGASGSGKSTLMSVLGGFAEPSTGTIRLDGEALPSLRSPAWQHRASFIPQDPYIFHASLRENVAFCRPDADDREIARAIELAGLNEFVAQLPEGLDTQLGQGARGVSGGQAHRIALARAFLDDARSVLLLDEPTAHLDIETEYELKERLLPLMEGKLVFFATHRLHWMAQMDYVIELQAGRVAWQGPAAQWVEKKSAEGGGYER